MHPEEVAEMSFNQTRDILDHARDFHRRLSRFYEELQDLAPVGQVQVLLENLIDHEQTLAMRLKEYEEEVSDNILDTFFKYMVDGTDSYFSTYAIPDVVDTAAVIDAARYFDDCLTSFYREMARKAMSEQVREVLLNLMEMELREQMMLSKQALELSCV